MQIFFQRLLCINHDEKHPYYENKKKKYIADAIETCALGGAWEKIIILDVCMVNLKWACIVIKNWNFFYIFSYMSVSRWRVCAITQVKIVRYKIYIISIHKRFECNHLRFSGLHLHYPRENYIKIYLWYLATNNWNLKRCVFLFEKLCRKLLNSH